MYADRSAVGCSAAGATCLAVTGYDATQLIFLLVSAAVLLIAGFTLIQMFRAKPSQIQTGPKSKR